MIGLLGRQGPAANLRQHCPQMSQRPGISFTDNLRRQQELNAQLSAITRENDEKRRRRVICGKIQGKEGEIFFLTHLNG